jgi:predicted amidophosphoribosyltransferase
LIDVLDPGPFLAWFDARVQRLGMEYENPKAAVYGELGWLNEDAATRRLFRWRNEGGQAERKLVEEALLHAHADIGKIYPELAVDVELEPEGWCKRCHEIVTPVEGCCPWCDMPVGAIRALDKGYCPVCDTRVVRTNAGTCWRCGTAVQRGSPWIPCACNCGRLIQQFDRHGRRVRYVHGHAPRSLETKTKEVDVEPFARYLEERLANLDPIAALAREHGIARRDVVMVLRRDQPTVSRDLVQRAVWIFGQNGKGMPRRPDATSFFDLYPEDERAKICPGCGKGKSPHAKLCKLCRRKRTSPRPPTAVIHISEEVLTEAYAAYRNEGLTLLALAEQLLDRVPHRSAGSLAGALSAGFRQRGWPMRQRPSRAA